MKKKIRKSNTISVIVLDKENAVKYIPLIRKWTNQSISEIKQNILSGESVLVSEHSKSLQNLIDIHQHILDLKGKGAELRIIMDTSGYIEDIDVEMIESLIRRDREIDKEVDEIWDLEARAMEEEEN